MRKHLLIIALLLLLEPLAAQNNFNLSFLASPQIAWLSSDSRYVHKDGSFFGFGYGIEGDFYFGKGNYALVTGLTMSTTGGKLRYNTPIRFYGSNLAGGTSIEYRLNNLEIPLAIKLRTRDFNRSRYYAQFGLTNWINVSAKGTSSDGTFYKENIRDEVRTFSSGLNVGGGLEYDLGHSNYLTFGLIYSNGFTDITSNSTINDNTTLKSLRFRFGFVF